MAGVIAAVDLAHLDDHRAVYLACHPVVGRKGAHDQAHRLAMAARNVLPAAFQALQAAARGDATRLYFAQRRGGRVLQVAVREAHAAASEGGLDVVLRHAHPRHQDVVTRGADGRHRHRRHARLQAEGGQGHFLRLHQRRLGVLQQRRGHAEGAAVALEDERDLERPGGVQHRGDRGGADGIDVLVVARLHR